MEDKKCRICGLADMANTNIYHPSSKLVQKIVAVYPIVLYPNDPLPKHICKKCVVSTTNMYAEIERAVRNQNKWITNVRTVQPHNKFVKVIDSIKNANKKTSLAVSKMYDETLGERTVSHMFNINSSDHCLTCSETTAPPAIGLDVDIQLSPNATGRETKNVPKSPEQSIREPSSKITEIKSVLELNGCTLTKVKSVKKRQMNEIDDNEPNTMDFVKVVIKDESPSGEECSQSAITCKMCPFHCETLEELAIHQLSHLSLAVPKLSERRYLNKITRRGRLIRVENKKCIRCLNCWRIFVDNKAILNHWYMGDCDFFCRVCGKEFAASPKMLREHVPAAHGISYRSSKSLRPPPLSPKKIRKSEKSLPTPDSYLTTSSKGCISNEALSVKVACHICSKVFANFKARNSHMRAHKPLPQLSPESQQSLSDTLLGLKLLPVKDEPEDYDDIPYHIVTALDAPTTSTNAKASTFSSSALHLPLHPPPGVMSKSLNSNPRTNSPAGIRRKFVQVRTDSKAITFKTETNTHSAMLKVKSLVDLQDPSVSSQQSENSLRSHIHSINSNNLPPGSAHPTCNGIGIQTPKDNMNYGQIFNCHPCGGKFTSKLELFRHKRKCTANNLYPCQFCPKQFLTSADLQIHIMLLHKNSGPPCH